MTTIGDWRARHATHVRRLLAGILGLALIGLGQPAAAQPPAPDTPSQSDEVRVYRMTGARIGIGQNIIVERDEEVRDAVVVVGGSLRVDGRVRDGIVVIGGDVSLGPTADVRGDVVLLGGTLTRADGARLSGTVSDMRFGHWRASWPQVSFDPWPNRELGRWVSLAGTLFRLSLLAVLMGVFLLFARTPIARVGLAATTAPGQALLVGFAAEVLFVPALIVASVGLALTIIGIPFIMLLVPLAMFVAFVALMLGFTALACRLGEWLEDRLGVRLHSAFLAAGIGLLIIATPTLLSRVVGVAPEPLRYAAFGLLVAGAVVEFLVWTIGLGATLMTSFGRQTAAPPPIPAT